MPIPVTPAPTSSAPKTWCSPRAAGGHWYVPVWRSRCRSGTWGWCTRDRGSLLGSGLPCSTRPVRSTPGTGGRSWSTWSTTIPWRRPRYPVATGSPSLSYSGWSGQTSTSSRSFPSPVGAPAGTARPEPERAQGGGTVIFSRDRGSGRRAKGDEPGRGARHAARRRERDEFGYPDEDDDAAEARAETGGTTGPYDIADAPAGDRLDLGSMQVPAVEGVEVRVHADPDGAIHQVVLVHGDSALQLGVFAAPRSEGTWDEVRADIRFVGIDGPRWMVRAVYQGPAAVDPDAAEPLAECLRGLVVDRGTE